MRILAFCYAAILSALILWLVWEWRVDIKYRKRWEAYGRRRGDRMPPLD